MDTKCAVTAYLDFTIHLTVITYLKTRYQRFNDTAWCNEPIELEFEKVARLCSLKFVFLRLTGYGPLAM